MYLTKKYIHWYKIEINISQRDCHQRMNQFLIEQGYKPKKITHRFFIYGMNRLRLTK